ncbi:MAG TPA: hypothetical protein V6C82_03690 [Chroococcales cyanobacterium]|jgi:hypothetical protein
MKRWALDAGLRLGRALILSGGQLPGDVLVILLTGNSHGALPLVQDYPFIIPSLA